MEKLTVKDLPKTKECHCGHTAHRYRHRSFVNQLGQTVYRVFFRCEHCWSRISDDVNPEMDAKPTIDVSDLLKKYQS